MIPASGCGVLCAGGEVVQRDFLNFWNVVVGALRVTPKAVLHAKTSAISWQAKGPLCTGFEPLPTWVICTHDRAKRVPERLLTTMLCLSGSMRRFPRKCRADNEAAPGRSRCVSLKSGEARRAWRHLQRPRGALGIAEDGADGQQETLPGCDKIL